MGLDMYAVSKPRKNSKNSKEIAYWRKHPNLQGWMERLWRYKSGNATDDFNCVEVELTSEDLDQLENAVRNGKLPDTQGFFYGSDSDDYYREQDLKFIREARADILCGLKIFYSSWW